jgi:membrane dipeptidase
VRRIQIASCGRGSESTLYTNRIPSRDRRKRSFAAFVAFILVSVILLTAQISDRARALHRSALVFDAHIHAIEREFYNGGDIGQRKLDGQFDLPRARDGGLGAMFFSFYVTEDYYPGRFETKQALRLIDACVTQIQANGKTIEIAHNATEIERIHAAGKIAAVLDIEGSFDLDGDLAVMRNFYRLGLRSMQLSAHNWQNNYADSCCSGTFKNNGLNERGRAWVHEANRLGMVINVSHASDDAISQAIDISTDPVIATHHGLRQVNDIPRTMPDWLLKKLAAKGGVMGFQIGNEFHNRKVFDWVTEHAGKPFWDTKAIHDRAPMSIFEIDKVVAHGFPMAGAAVPDDIKLTVDGWVDVVDKAIQMVGEDHVALGTDFDGGPTPPRGMRDVSDLPLITDAMVRRGYSDDRIRKFLGGNLLRVFRRITEKR